MGLQQSCLENQVKDSLVKNPQLPIARQLTLESTLQKCDPYNLTEQAQRTYKSLSLKIDNQPSAASQDKQGSKDIKKFDGFYKLDIYDACYNGDWKNLKPHGKGTAIFPNGTILIGSFFQGYCQGKQNYYIYANGSYYVGQMESNKIKGKGKFVNDIITYQGCWNDNLPHGEGIQCFSNGDKYIGKFQIGQKQGSDSIFIWGNHPNYVQYKGSFKEGRINGFGTLTLRNKNKIQGIFNEADIKNCTFTSDKYKFSGSYHNGKINGSGRLEIVQIQQTFVGNFVQNKMAGEFKITDSKNRQIHAYFFNNRQLKKAYGLPDSEIERIITIIQNAYSPAKSHNQALADISQDLDQYQCRFIEPFENIFKNYNYLTVSIYNKILLVKEKKRNDS